MDKFIDEEKNMLENDPEIRDPSLRTKPSLWERLLWRRWYKGSSAVLSLAVPAAVVMSLATLTSCTPQVDEMQQKAYKNYLSALDNYKGAVNSYNKLEVADKPSLPATLVFTDNLDDKTPTETLQKRTDTLNAATIEINELCEALKNNDTQKAAYRSYLLVWNEYENAVADYQALENPDKPALPEELILTKLSENATVQELNNGNSALQNATAEINKLIKQYEQETPTPPNPDKPMTKEEIVEKVTSAVESNVKASLGNGVTEINYLALDYKEIEGKHFIDILTEYQDPRVEKGTKSIRLVRVPMQTELSEENIKNGTFKPKNEWDASTVVNVPTKTADTRDREVLAKLNPSLAETNPTFISLTKVSGAIIEGLGKTNEVKLYIINGNGITIIKTNARSDGNRTDPIGQSILAETAKEGTDYTKPVIENFKFGENVILLGEMFQNEQAQEYENVDAEINGVRYAIIRNQHTVYNEELDKIMKEPESY